MKYVELWEAASCLEDVKGQRRCTQGGSGEGKDAKAAGDVLAWACQYVLCDIV